MAAAIDGGSGSTDEEEEEVVGGGVFDGLAFGTDSASTVEAFEGSLSQVIADTTDGAADGNFVVEYTKTPNSKNYAGVIVGDLTVTWSTFLSTLEAASLPLRRIHCRSRQGCSYAGC